MREANDLALETRRSIYELVEEFPGLHFREIARRLDMSPSNAEYHLRYLVKHDILVVVEDGRLKRFYVRGRVSKDDKRILAVLRNEISRGLVLFLLLNPDSTVEDMLDAFGLSPGQISYSLKKLVSSPIVSSREEGGEEFFFVCNPEAVAGLLIAFRPSFMDVLVDNFVDAWLGREKRRKGKKNGRKKDANSR